MGTKVYNADEVIITVGPVIVDSGYADGEFLRVESTSDIATMHAGTDGEQTFSRTNDDSATVTIILMQTSDSNTGLGLLATSTKEAPGMLGGIVPLVIKDMNGISLYTAPEVIVARSPDVSFDREPTAREWKILVAHLKRVDGGN